jgi:hypothetical protein
MKKSPSGQDPGGSAVKRGDAAHPFSFGSEALGVNELRERHYERQRLVAQRRSALIGVPLGRAVVLCIDDEHNAPDFSRSA